jgi:predicted DNA-binding mobile mystery protein A
MKDKLISRLRKRDRDALRLQQFEDSLAPVRSMGELRRPNRGWIRAIREGLGMTNVQLTKRMRMRAPQTIEDMQKLELTETIQVGTLRRLAEAMGCRLVYAVVPPKSLAEMRRDRARQLAERIIKRTAHSMRLEGQGISGEAERRQLENLIEQILAEDPKELWQ